MLIRLAMAEQRGDRGGTHPQLDALFWQGIQELCWAVLRDVETVISGADARSQFVTLPCRARTAGRP